MFVLDGRDAIVASVQWLGCCGRRVGKCVSWVQLCHGPWKLAKRVRGCFLVVGSLWVKNIFSNNLKQKQQLLILNL